MATSTRRRKPAPAGAATPDIPDLLPDTPAEAAALPAAADPPAAAPEAAAAPAPAKRARAPRKTAAAPRKTAAAPRKTAAAPRKRSAKAAPPVADDTGASAVAADAPVVEPPAAEPPAAEPTAVEAVVAEAAAEPLAPPVPEASRLTLQDGLQRRLCWQPGSACPETLARAVTRWQAAPDAPAPALALALTHLDELSELLAIAARTGHAVEVDEAVWLHLARLGDLQGRIAHLEARHPQGLDPAAQPAGSLLAGRRACELEAAFFAACVGRCVLGDEPALQPDAELLLAARLVMQHFGAQAPVVLAPADAHGAWQQAWARAWPSDPAADPTNERPALTLLSPDQAIPPGTELLLLDQRSGLQPATAEGPAAQAATWLWVLAPHDVLARPEAPALFSAVDQLRQGGLAAWQADGDAAALAPLLLARRFAGVAAQWPAWAPAVRNTPAAPGEAALRDELAQRVARWQRSGFLADSDQLALRRLLQSLWAQSRTANIAALPALLNEALAAGAGRIVVFSEDAAAQPALAASLQAAGLPAEPQIVLVADAADAADAPDPAHGRRIDLHGAAPLLIHLDTPWPAGALARRLQRARPGPAQREVPVWQLLPEASLMARRALALAALPADLPGASATRLTGPLLRGPALDAWAAELAALL